MIARACDIEPALSIGVASEKAQGAERPTFYLITGILALAMVAFAAVCMVAVLAVFFGGVR